MNSKGKPDMLDGYKYLYRSAKLKWDKHGGKICTIAGTTGLILSGIHACRKTYKIHDELRENGRRISEARKDQKGDRKFSKAGRVLKEIGKSSFKTSRHYVPSIVGGVASGYAVGKGWHIEHTHFQQAAAMVGVVMADFMNYRRNVIADQGEDADRRYLTTKRDRTACISSGENGEAKVVENGDEHVIQLPENALRIWYSKYTTPSVWSESHALRMCNLKGIQNNLDIDLIHGGSFSVNDVRRYFYGRKGDIPEGGMFGRIWDPGNPEHPERGAKVNLHFEEDEDFMCGISDSCWIIIDIDSEPLFELLKGKQERDLVGDIR